MDWTQLWIDVFGTTEWLGLNMGFWVSTAVVVLIVVIMNVVFWSVKVPGNGETKGQTRLPGDVRNLIG